MKIKKPKNKNYCATIVRIKNIIQLENCANIAHTNIFGNLVIIPKDIKIGELGLYFPPETQLSDVFTKYNNLYRKSEKNVDFTTAGYLENNRRIKTMKFRGYKSMGLFLPISYLNSLPFLGEEYKQSNLVEGIEFDELNGVEICRKYTVKKVNMYSSNIKPNKRGKKFNRIIEEQFRFHEETSQLGKNIYKIYPNDIISITYKLHGTSFISSNILVKKELNILDKLLKFFGVKIVDTKYDNIYSSRKIIKNKYLNPKNKNYYYDENIWANANKKIKEYLVKGMTVYGEIVGYLSNGSYIQKPYDYGCQPGNFEIYIYRITHTNVDGLVFEFSAKQVQDWCSQNGLNAVPEKEYGYAKNIFRDINEQETLEDWRNKFLEFLKEKYLEKYCYICKNQVPEEGIVLRKEKNDLEVYKLKSFLFYEKETKMLDKGIVDIEEQ